MFFEKSIIEKYKFSQNQENQKNQMGGNKNTDFTSFPTAGIPIYELLNESNFSRFDNLVVPLGFVYSKMDEEPKPSHQYSPQNSSKECSFLEDDRFNLLFEKVGFTKKSHNKTKKKNKKGSKRRG